MVPMSYDLRFPVTEPHELEQDQAFFTLLENGLELKIRFHDYPELYRRQGLYEQLFYQRLKCASPEKVTGILDEALRNERAEVSELRVLDLGAGNGMVGEHLHKKGVARIIGVDISKDAREACFRDRIGVYDEYYVSDLRYRDSELLGELKKWKLNCLISVAALGFGDIPVRAFSRAFSLIPPGGWLAINIKDSFLLQSDTSGFSRFIKSLLLEDGLEVHHLERYRHRISIDGKPLFYYALVGKKKPTSMAADDLDGFSKKSPKSTLAQVLRLVLPRGLQRGSGFHPSGGGGD